MTAASVRRPAARAASGGPAQAARLGVLRGGLEIRMFFRQRDGVLFTFALPVILLALFGSIFTGTVGHTGVSYKQYFAAGIIASGIMSASFVNLGVGVSTDRDDGTLLRLAGTPAPAAAYFIGKAICAMVVTVAEVAIMLAVAVPAFGLRLPATPGRWLTLAWVVLLGTAACSLLGIAVSGLARSARGASAVVTLPYLVLSFISGVYFVFSSAAAGLAAGGRAVPAEVDVPGAALGLPAAGVPGRRGRARLAAGPGRPGAGGLAGGKLGAMPDDVPLAAAGLVEPGRARKDAWAGSLRRWDGYFAVVVLITASLILITSPLPASLISAAALAALALWYALAGRPAMTGEQEERPVRTLVYLAGAFVLLAVASGADQTASLVLAGLCPQCFMALRFRRAVLAVAVIACAPLAAGAATGTPGPDLAADAAIAGLTVAFSMAFASWITRIIHQSDERGRLIEQLEATRAQLASAHRESGVLAERQRLSAEIHDTIAQGMASIVMLLQAAEAGLRTDPDAAARHLALASDTARDSLAEARGLVAGLAPAGLQGGSLDQALARVAALARRQAGLAADLEVGGTTRPLATSTEVMLLRVCQEALSNVRKHAGATRARVRLDYAGEEVELEVTDDGRGFDPGAVAAGYGLSGMRTRVAEAGGALEVRSAPGAGTAVTVRVRA